MKRLLLLLLTLCAFDAQAVERVIHYHNDALGSPIFATNQRGELVWRRSYTPYGEELNREAPNEPGYTGKLEEPDLGISDFGARWYDPRIGRFLAIDPVGFSPDNPQSFNRYAYANNNPYGFVDPDGRSTITKAAKLIINGGDFAETFSDVIQAAALVADPSASIAARALAALEIASEFAPASIGDAKDVAKLLNRKVYRVWGDGAGANGRSWSRTDPITVENYRDSAGLPNHNSGRFVTEGTLTSTKGVTQRDALPLHGNKGGLDELVVPDPAKQIRVDHVSGVNPQF